MTIGETIRLARISTGLTQKQLGEKLGYTGRVAEVTVQRWEHDQRPIPREHLKPLAQMLKIPVDSLLP